ncbi:MAG: hypothetical protein SPI08_04185, partial [Campylobacter sp.]|nr:hypothetical protein [Campylobacter sp.]
SLLPLQKGLKIVIANENEQNDIRLFNSLCLKNNVNIIQTTPSRFQVLISNSNELDYLKTKRNEPKISEPSSFDILKLHLKELIDKEKAEKEKKDAELKNIHQKKKS